MGQIINFLIKHKNTLLFLCLFVLALFFTIQSHSYQKSKFISSANFLTGGVYGWVNDIDEYFNLENYNERLVEENRWLRARLMQLQSVEKDSVFVDSSRFGGPYRFIAARVLKNEFSKRDNYILLNKGKRDSIHTDYGVITSRGIVGIVEETTQGFSRVISILNSNLSVSVQLQDSEHFGSLSWKGGDPNIVQLTEIPRLAPVKKGDTIMTNGRSFIFPKGLPVGIIEDFKMDQSQSYYTIDVRLFNDMTNIGYVYIIENKNKPALEKLEEVDE